MKTLSITILLSLFVLSSISFGQNKLKPGFDAVEYGEALKVSAHQGDTPWVKAPLPLPEGYRMVYRSPVVGLDNRWDLWLRDDSVAVISIRGTTIKPTSWLEDFYSAMVPAAGTLTAGKNNVFRYRLASDTNTYVHIGFLLGLAYLAPTIIQEINEYYNKGVKDFIIMGHSQGGAISYLLTSYLHYLDKGIIPDDIRFKTYSSAPPKPGNSYYAYDYEFITRGGWSYRIINELDWVPQMPFTVQTKFDFNKNGLFYSVDTAIADLGLMQKIVYALLKRSLIGDVDEARDVLIKYLGEKLYGSVEKNLPGFKEPRFVKSMEYMTCGSPVILKPTSEYLAAFPYEKGVRGIFVHHNLDAYYYLLEHEYINER